MGGQKIFSLAPLAKLSLPPLKPWRRPWSECAEKKPAGSDEDALRRSHISNSVKPAPLRSVRTDPGAHLHPQLQMSRRLDRQITHLAVFGTNLYCQCHTRLSTLWRNNCIRDQCGRFSLIRRQKMNNLTFLYRNVCGGDIFHKVQQM